MQGLPNIEAYDRVAVGKTSDESRVVLTCTYQGTDDDSFIVFLSKPLPSSVTGTYKGRRELRDLSQLLKKNCGVKGYDEFTQETRH